MEVKYVAVYKLRGANGLSGDDPLGLCEDENPNITATLTANSEPYFEHIDRSLMLIRESGCKSGLVFNPATPLDYLKHVIDKVDMILLMSVNPGFGGQSFIPAALDKLRAARRIIDASGRNIRLEIDGGVKVDNIAEIAAAGADTFVSGSGIFGQAAAGDAHGYDSIIRQMRAELERAASI